jgi:hypothetical protein
MRTFLRLDGAWKRAEREHVTDPDRRRFWGAVGAGRESGRRPAPHPSGLVTLERPQPVMSLYVYGPTSPVKVSIVSAAGSMRNADVP